VNQLDRSRKRGELPYLFGRRLDGLLEQRPHDALRAWRRRERAHVAEKATFSGHQRARIDRGPRVPLRTLQARHGAPDRLQSTIRLAGPDEDADDRKIARRRTMHEMAFEIERLAGEQVFARMVEVELLQFVDCAADHAGRTGCGIHLDRVPIVDDPQLHRLICDIHTARLRRNGVGEINRRLFEAELADLERRGELSPVCGLAFIGPVRRSRPRRGMRRLLGLRTRQHPTAGAADRRRAEKGASPQPVPGSPPFARSNHRSDPLQKSRGGECRGIR
jgi:hypothetical protein